MFLQRIKFDVLMSEEKHDTSTLIESQILSVIFVVHESGCLCINNCETYGQAALQYASASLET